MKKQQREIAVMEEPDLDGREDARPLFELPEDDEFVCTTQEVLEACADYQDTEGAEGLS